MAEPLQFLGRWEEAKKRRLELTLQALAPYLRPRYREVLRGPWVAKVSRDPDGTCYYVLHRVGMGAAVTGHSVEELIDGLVASGIYGPPFSSGAI